MIDDFNQFLAIGPVKRTFEAALQVLEHVSMTAPGSFSFECPHQALVPNAGLLRKDIDIGHDHSGERQRSVTSSSPAVG